MDSGSPHDKTADPGFRSARSVISGYSLATAAFAVAFVLTLFIRSTTGNPTFFSFYVAIFLSVWFGGRGPGWLATALAMVALHSVFRSVDDMLIVTGEKLPTLLAFLICMVTADVLSTQRYRAESALRAARDRLELAVQDRTAELRLANVALSNEITERRRAESAVRASEDRWRRLFEASSAGMALTDMTSRYIATNSAFQKMLGYSDGEFKALTAIEITHPDEVTVTQDVVADFVSGARQEYHVDKRYLKKDGTPLWVNVTTTYVPATEFTPPMLQGVYFDIDDRKRVEAAVRVSEERWRRLFEASAAGMALIDLSGRYVATNSAFQNMLGYTDEEFKTLTALAISHPDERAVSQARYADFVSGARQEYHIEKRYLKKDGTPIWANVTIAYVPACESTSALLQVVIIDIDDRKRAEAGLRASEERWRTVFETASVGIATSDASRRILSANATLQQLLGYTQEELQALGWDALTHEDDDTLTDDLAIDLMRGRERAFRAEKRYRRKDGELIWVSVNASYVPASEASRAGFASIIVDINDRKRAEQALRASEERWRRVFETSSVGIATSDESLRVATANAAFQRMIGYSEIELRKMRWIDLTHEDDRGATEDLVRSLLDGQLLAYNMEKRYRRKDGETIWVNVYNAFVPATATTPAFLPAIIVDITDRIHAQAALQRSQAELTRVARVTTMGELAASIAHEINQPLAAIVASSNACRRWIEAQKWSRARDSLERVIADANRASEVIKRVRSLTSNTAPERFQLNINTVIKEVLALTRGELQARQVSLQLELNDDSPLVRGDKVQLQQVVLNLVMNAIDAMSGVTDRRRVLSITCQRSDRGGALVTVQDCGPGIEPENAERIFQPFFTTKPGGMGMGLSISNSIVEAHGGRLWASPAPPFGTAFHFSLPEAKSRPA